MIMAAIYVMKTRVRIIAGFAFILLSLLVFHPINGQQNLRDSIFTNKQPALIAGISYQPFTYSLSPLDEDTTLELKSSKEMELWNVNVLRSYSIAAHLLFQIKSYHYIKTELAYSSISLFYNAGIFSRELPRFEESFSTFVYDYGNSLKLTQIRMPILYSHQRHALVYDLGISVNLGLVLSYTKEYSSHSKLYRALFNGSTGDFEETDILAYEIIMNSETSTYHSLRYDLDGETKSQTYNHGDYVARRAQIGGVAEAYLHYNFSANFRADFGAWANVDFTPIEKVGRAGEVTPFLAHKYYTAPAHNPHFYGIRYGFSVGFSYMLP